MWRTGNVLLQLHRVYENSHTQQQLRVSWMKWNVWVVRNERKIYGKSIFFTTATSALFFFLHTLMLLTQNFFVVFSSPLHSSVEIPQVLRSVRNRDFVTWLECQKEKRDERRSTKKVWRLKDVGAITNYVTCEAFLDFSSTPWSSWILNTHG